MKVATFKRATKSFLFFFILHSSFFITPVVAQVTGEVEGLALTAADPRVVAARIIQVALGFLGVIVFGLILYGGFVWMTAAGDEEKIVKAKRILTNAVIGLVIIMSSFAISTFVLRSLQRAARGPSEVTLAGTGNYGSAGSPSYFLVRSVTPRGEIPIRNAVVRVEFNRSVDPATVTGESFQVKRLSGPRGSTLDLVEGTRLVRGTTVEFRPTAACPAPNENRRCFEADTWFRVSVEPALRSRDGLALTCNLPQLAYGQEIGCTGEFRTGNLVDLAPPTVTVESPDDGASVRVDSCVPVQARARDDAGISMVEFFADGVLIEPGGVAVPPPGETAVRDALFEIPCFDTSSMPTPSIHRLRAKAYDIDDNLTDSREVSVVVRPAHCFNGIQDGGETGEDCGGECGACDGSTCTSNAQCSGGTCVAGRCASPTTITGVFPGDGREGTLVTIGGRGFGEQTGAVTFTPNREASAPQACSGATTWADHFVLIGVPEGAQTGPITVAQASCAAGDALCRDATNDARGPIVPMPDGSFEVNEVAHPGLCSATPTSGGWNAGVALSGVQFGALSGQAGVSFSGVPAPASNWNDTSAQTAVPPLGYGASLLQITNAQGIPSNALPFSVLAPDAGTLPEIISVTPDEGGPGQGITIQGRNFGEQSGLVWFTAPDGQRVQADTSVPSQCGNTFWSLTAITVKVPRVTDQNDRDQDGNRSEMLSGDYEIYVRRYDAQESNRKAFEMNNTPPGPFLACALPAAGSRLTNVSIFGERLGQRPGQDDGVFFTSQGASTGNSALDNWVGSRATLTSAGGIPSDSCPTGGWSTTEICTQVPVDAVGGDMVVETTVAGLSRRSNPLNFAVGACTGVPEDQRISCGALSCCGDGSCNLTCFPAAAGRGAFGWTFTTAPEPIVPRVVEFCDTASGVGHPTAPPSPAPWDRKMGEEVCLNAALSVRFSTKVDDATVRPNLKVETCTAPENFLDDPGFEQSAQDWDPGVVEPTHLTAARVLGLDRSGQGNYGLQLTKLDDDVGVGPGPPDAQGRHSNYEHWFGYEADVITDTDGKTYTASAWMKAGNPQAVGKRAGVVLQRNGGNFERRAVEIVLSERWQQIRVSHTFSDLEGVNVPGLVRIFLEGLPNQGGAPNNPLEIFAAQIDDVEVTTDPCTQSTLVDTTGWSAPQIYAQDLRSEGLIWLPPARALLQNTWYRVTLFGETGGIRAEGEQGRSMQVLQDAQAQCGDIRAAYCWRFKTRNSAELCKMGAIAVSPNPWTARAQFENVNYQALPTAADDPCIALNPALYSWQWLSSNPAQAAIPAGAGRACQTNLDCLVGSCVGGFCNSMGWTTTATALAETAREDPVEISAQVEDIQGEGKLHIQFVDPVVESYWPSCGEACTNAAVGGRFNVAMQRATVEDPQNVQVWSVSCGNGEAEHGEDCDDGNTQDGDGCSALCLNEGSNFRVRCGDNDRDSGEDCDDGNLVSGDGCSGNCLNEGVSVNWSLGGVSGLCGNGVVERNSANGLGEECDDGNSVDGDGCSARCLNEGTRADIPVCGNRRIETGEECEANFDGSFASWCNELTCLRQGTSVPLCGNGRIDSGEECDRTFAGNFAPNGLCNASTCLWVGTLQPQQQGGQGCGNGRIEIGEDCDDGNRRPGDGCSSTCLNEGAVTTAIPVCGNGRRDPGEDCDDSNIEDGDGCSARCLNEGTDASVCGNSVVERGEDCDQGLTSPALCSADCQNLGTVAPTCGNGVRNDGEDCDDGNTQDGDGCSARCLNEGREAEQVPAVSVIYYESNRTFDLGIPALAPATLYRVLLRGDDPETAVREGILSSFGKPLAGLNLAYQWGSGESPLATLPSGVSPNTFSWTFQTSDTTCNVNRVEVLPEAASLYVVGSRQSYSAQPFGPPDSCDPAGQRLNPLTYQWVWSTQDPAVAIILGAPGVDLIPGCGNGRLERGEDCDDGNSVGGDGCSPTCLNEGSNFPLACGNLVTRPVEECDDGNSISGDGCSPRCLNEGSSPPACGNDNLDWGEDCDDGNFAAGDGCSPTCLNEGSSIQSGLCGNGVVDEPAGEECDPQDTVTRSAPFADAPLLASFCHPETCLLLGTAPRPRCGNSLREAGEDCDDGGVLSGDGCSAQCLNEGSLADGAVCGNGSRERGEDCDDGNSVGGDGCSGNCLNEGTVEEIPQQRDPFQQAQARGLREQELARGWSTVEVEAEAEDKTGGSPLTVFCVAQDDTDCPIPRSQPGYTGQGSEAVGRGLSNCCYSRPRALVRMPTGEGVCRNATLIATFSEALDEATLPGNIKIVKVAEEETCPPGTPRVDEQGNIVFLQGAQGRDSLLARLWNWLGSFVRRIFTGAQAQDTVLCAVSDLTVSATFNSDTQELNLRPSQLLQGNTRYRILIIGDRNINDAPAEGVRSALGVGLSGVDSSWNFRTGPDICTLDEVRIQVNGSTTLTRRAEERPVEAQGWTLRQGGQRIQPLAGYRWRWSWYEEEAEVAYVSREDEPAPPEGGQFANQTVTAGSLNGSSTITATATIFEDAITGAVNRTLHGTERFTTIICDNPWPQAGGEPTPYRDPSDSATNMNFETMYCRDKGRVGPEEDLPDLEYPGAVLSGSAITQSDLFSIAVNGESSAIILREFLLPVIHEKQPRDAIGIRVMTNPDRLDPLSWYRAQGFRGSPEIVREAPDSFTAIRDGRSIYIGAPNAIPRDPAEGLGFRVFSNIYIISYNEGAEPATREIFEQLVANLRFAVNLANSKVCSSGSGACSSDLDCGVSGTQECIADKDKLRRDLTRMNHFAAISGALQAYRRGTGAYPALEAGTFVRSLSTSRWPSWQATLGATLGAPLPLDPLNRFTDACPEGYDPLTCWNEQEQKFRCPAGSRIYQYRSFGGVEAEFSADFERLGRTGWEVPGWPPQPSVNQGLALSIQGTCEWRADNGLSIWSNAAPLCGNRIVEGNETCERPDADTVSVTLTGLHCTGEPSRLCGTNTDCIVNGASRGVCAALNSCTARRSCNVGCEWNPWQGGEGAVNPGDAGADDCIAGGTFCGNGLLERGEACDDGLLNGQYGKCNSTCTAPHEDYCGDGDTTHGEVCDEGEMNGSYGRCRFDCSAMGERCGDGAVQESEEQCDGNTQVRPAGRCAPAGDEVAPNAPCDDPDDCGEGGRCIFCEPSPYYAGIMTIYEPAFSPEGYPYGWRRSCGSGCAWSGVWECVPQGGCGNGIVDGNEQCDDGTVDDGINDETENSDGCTNLCRRALCGDGYDQGRVCTSGAPHLLGRSCTANQQCGAGGVCQDPEECDLGAQNGVQCNPRYSGTCTYCDSRCNTATLSGGVCGDTVRNGPEQCDGGAGLGSWVCAGVPGQTEALVTFDSISGWTSGGGADVQVSQSSPGYGSANALLINRNTTSGSRWAQANVLSSIPAGTYRVSVFVNEGNNAARGRKVRLQNQTDSAVWKQITLDTDPDSWQLLERDFQYGAGPAKVIINLVDGDAYAVLADNVYLRAIHAPICGQGGLACQTVCPMVMSPCENLATDTDTDSDGLKDECDNDRDADGDPRGTDCNDRNPAFGRDAREVCDDGLDNNCNGLIDECLDTSIVISDALPSPDNADVFEVFLNGVSLGRINGTGLSSGGLSQQAQINIPRLPPGHHTIRVKVIQVASGNYFSVTLVNAQLMPPVRSDGGVITANCGPLNSSNTRECSIFGDVGSTAIFEIHAGQPCTNVGECAEFLQCINGICMPL